MRETNGARAATAGHSATPKVAPRFTRAAQAERSRLEDKREQLRRKREAVQTELERIDRADAAIGELLELLEPLLAVNGSESAAATTTAGPRLSLADPGRTARRMSAIAPCADRRGCDRTIVADQPQPARE